MSKEENLIKNLFKNSIVNVIIIGSFYSCGYYFINYKTKEEISALYEKKFQKQIIEDTTEDVFGNIKEKKRIDLFGKSEKKK